MRDGTTTVAAPPEVGGYRIVRELKRGASYLAEASGGRPIVLKLLDEDCLTRGQLHPSIKDRLGRVRELAHAKVANLYSVERDGDWVYLVWEHVEGETWEQYTASGRRGPKEVLALARELAFMVESLHALGIVHGRIHGRNIIVGSDGSLRLTHVSPLLYTDASEDAEAVRRLLAETVEKRGEAASPLGRTVQANGRATPLRQLATRLAAAMDAREEVVTAPRPRPRGREEGTVRRKALVAAGVVVLAVIGAAYGVRHFVGGPSSLPVPLEAGSEAMGR